MSVTSFWFTCEGALLLSSLSKGSCCNGDCRGSVSICWFSFVRLFGNFTDTCRYNHTTARHGVVTSHTYNSIVTDLFCSCVVKNIHVAGSGDFFRLIDFDYCFKKAISIWFVVIRRRRLKGSGLNHFVESYWRKSSGTWYSSLNYTKVWFLYFL